jgi:hypothetical protein
MKNEKRKTRSGAGDVVRGVRVVECRGGQRRVKKSREYFFVSFF